MSSHLLLFGYKDNHFFSNHEKKDGKKWEILGEFPLI